MVNQSADVFRPCPQRRDLKPDHVEAVVEVFPETARGDKRCQISRGVIEGNRNLVNAVVPLAIIAGLHYPESLAWTAATAASRRCLRVKRAAVGLIQLSARSGYIRPANALFQALQPPLGS